MRWALESQSIYFLTCVMVSIVASVVRQSGRLSEAVRFDHTRVWLLVAYS